MAKKSLKNSKHLVELINAIDLPALRLLGEMAPFDFLRSLDWTKSGADLRQQAIGNIADLQREIVGKADQESVRVLQLSHWRSEALLDYAARSLSFESDWTGDFDTCADVMTRLIWLLVRAPRLFDQIETIFIAHHCHGYKKYKPFKVRNGDHRDFVWTEEIGQKLQAEIGKILALDDEARSNCELIHFEMDDIDDGQNQPSKKLHYVVVYHPGKMKLLRQMKDRRRDILAFYPALEATLVYDAAENRIMVLADKMATRKALAECFSAIGFASPLSAEPLEEVAYDLTLFRHPVDLKSPRIRGAVIEQAWMSSMTVTIGHTPHRVTLTMNNDADIWSVVDEHYSNTNPFTHARSILEVNLSFVLRFDGADTPQALDVSITHRGACSLWSLPDPKLRYYGEEILVCLGVIQRIDGGSKSVDAKQLRAELELLDQPGDDVEGFLLRSLALDIAELEADGLIRKKDLGKSITRVVEDEEEGLVYQRLEVKSDSRHTWAVEPLTGSRLDLDEAELRRYAVNKAWLRERLTHRLSEQLSGHPLAPDDHEPFLLGYFRFGDQDIPISLATRLWHNQHAESMDLEIRKQALGVGVVLTTTHRRYRKFLGSSIVVPIEAILEDSPTGPNLNLARIEPEFRRWRALAETADEPKLIRESHGAILVGPWKDIWALSKPEHIASVEVLVTAWNSGKRKCSTEQVLAGYAGARSVPERFKGDPLWTVFIRSGDGHKRSRSWELNIGKPDYASAVEGDPGESEPSINQHDVNSA